MEKVLPDENSTDTMAYIDSARDWDIANQVYRVRLATVKDTPLTECRVYQRGPYVIVELNGIVHYWEHTDGSCYLKTAIDMIDSARPAKWKTLGALITLRQCCRECIAQGWGIEDDYFYRPLSESQYREFLRLGRSRDKVHHGSNTF